MKAVSTVEQEIHSSYSVHLLVIQRLTTYLCGNQIAGLVSDTSHSPDYLPAFRCHLLENHTDIAALQFQIAKLVLEREH